MDCYLASPDDDSRSLLALTPSELKPWSEGQSEAIRCWIEANSFKAEAGSTLLLPAVNGDIEGALFGLGEEPDLWTWASMPSGVKRGNWHLDSAGTTSLEDAALAWGLASYRFTRYKAIDSCQPRLAMPAGIDGERVHSAVEAASLARDLVNTPAEDLGPEELVAAISDLAVHHGATCDVIVGEDLLLENYPSIHIVGRAASRAPRLADLRWGPEDAARLTLVGKGVTFDSGGLDLKSAEGMKLMKKDMGGSASVIGLAHMIMSAGLPVRLRVLVPAVENAVSGNAFRPMDVITTRKGLTVEVGNTDAEGRLILSDALTEAASENPDLIIDYATLTGAARVALGTELPALFATDDSVAEAFLAAGLETCDPLWRMPLHKPYRRFIEGQSADLSNTGSSRTGGAITAALFLREFVGKDQNWCHIDTMGWNDSSRPGRPLGGEAFGIRAAFKMIEKRYSK